MDKKEGLVSVIIPVYNGRSIINDAIQSSLEQENVKVEVIVINDGSSDNLKKEDLIQDKRVLYFEKKNEGPGSARNLGVQKASGEFIFFLDADDKIPKNALSSLLKTIGENDFCIGKTERVFIDKNHKVIDRRIWKEKNYTQKNTTKYTLIVDTLSTNKLYRREFLVEKNIWFEKGYILEDKLFVLKVLEASNHFSMTDTVVHHWTVNKDGKSLSHIYTIKKLQERMSVNYRCISYTNDEKMKEVLIENIIKHDLKIYVNYSFQYTLKELQELYSIYEKFIEDYKQYINKMSFKQNKAIIKNISYKYRTITEFLRISRQKNNIKKQDSHYRYRDIILKLFLKLENIGIRL